MKHAIIILILISIPFIILSQSGNNIKLYVSTTGSDQAAGSVENPLGTLQKAVEVAREKRQPGRDCSITILIHEGKYYLERTVPLTSEDSVTDGSPFIITTFPDEMSASGMTGETGILIVELKASSPLFQNGSQGPAGN
jgi:hypothetical protein